MKRALLVLSAIVLVCVIADMGSTEHARDRGLHVVHSYGRELVNHFVLDAGYLAGPP